MSETKTTKEAPKTAPRPCDMVSMVEEFHRRFGLSYDGPPRQLEASLENFRKDFIKEEHREFQSAERDVDRLDGCVDMIYVIIGYAHLRGWNIREAFRRVHAANMTKVRAIDITDPAQCITPPRHAEDIVKLTTFVPPDLNDLV